MPFCNGSRDYGGCCGGKRHLKRSFNNPTVNKSQRRKKILKLTRDLKEEGSECGANHHSRIIHKPGSQAIEHICPLWIDLPSIAKSTFYQQRIRTRTNVLEMFKLHKHSLYQIHSWARNQSPNKRLLPIQHPPRFSSWCSPFRTMWNMLQFGKRNGRSQQVLFLRLRCLIWSAKMENEHCNTSFLSETHPDSNMPKPVYKMFWSITFFGRLFFQRF